MVICPIYCPMNRLIVTSYTYLLCIVKKKEKEICKNSICGVTKLVTGAIPTYRDNFLVQFLHFFTRDMLILSAVT